MCELFAMSARYPTTVQLSIEEFSRHGGLDGPHKDGWGIAWYDERDTRLVKEAFPASDSACLRFIQANPFVSPFVISHVRKATHGAVSLRNCQPFVRELGGAWHSFAHNGDLQRMEEQAQLQFESYRPVGETDSERAFCALLERMRALWLADRPPQIDARLRVVEAFACTLRELGPANFLYCDGDALFAHADRRYQKDGAIRPPGLWWLARHCPGGGLLAAEGLRIEAQAGAQDVCLIASVPLTGEKWMPMERGEILVARNGLVQQRPTATASPQRT